MLIISDLQKIIHGVLMIDPKWGTPGEVYVLSQKIITIKKTP